jgi:hypothetical protein
MADRTRRFAKPTSLLSAAHGSRRIRAWRPKPPDRDSVLTGQDLPFVDTITAQFTAPAERCSVRASSSSRVCRRHLPAQAAIRTPITWSGERCLYSLAFLSMRFHAVLSGTASVCSLPFRCVLVQLVSSQLAIGVRLIASSDGDNTAQQQHRGADRRMLASSNDVDYGSTCHGNVATARMNVRRSSRGTYSFRSAARWRC